MRALSLFLIVLLLVACSEEPQAQRPTPLPLPTQPPAAASPAATVPPAPTPTAIAISTAVPTGQAQPVLGALLPAPLYFIDEGQIQRLEVDGKTISRVTGELATGRARQAVLAFDTSPADGSLAYVIAEGEGTALIQTDGLGRERTVLVTLPSAQISNPRWSPDGSQIAVRIAPNSTDVEAGVASGVYLINALRKAPQAQAAPAQAARTYLPLVARSSDLRLLQADDPSDVDKMPGALFFAPLHWSPDGTRLLLNGQRQFNNFCIIAVKDLATGDLRRPETRPPLPDDWVTRCNEAMWSQDGADVLLNLQVLSFPVSAPGLWRVGAGSSRVEPRVPGKIGDETLLFLEPQQNADGSIYVFLSKTTQKPDPTYSPPLRYTMYRIAPDGTQQALRSDADQVRQALWSPTSNGAAVIRLEGLTPTAIWLPADGSAAVPLPASGSDLRNLRWGKG